MGRCEHCPRLGTQSGAFWCRCAVGAKQWNQVAGPPALGGPHLHLRHLVTIVVPFPRLPVDAICKALVGPPEVAPVEVGHVTVVIPPGSLVLHGTVFSISVVILVFGGESSVVVGRQGIACSEETVGHFTHSLGDLGS